MKSRLMLSLLLVAGLAPVPASALTFVAGTTRNLTFNGTGAGAAAQLSLTLDSISAGGLATFT